MIFFHLFLTMESALQNLQLLQICLMIFYILLHLKFNQKLLFNDYLPSTNHDSFTVTPTSKVEIDANISSRNSNKSTASNSIPLKILELTQNEISKNLADIFDLPFKTGVFPDSLEIAKVIPIHQKIQSL